MFLFFCLNRRLYKSTVIPGWLQVQTQTEIKVNAIYVALEARFGN